MNAVTIRNLETNCCWMEEEAGCLGIQTEEIMENVNSVKPELKRDREGFQLELESEPENLLTRETSEVSFQRRYSIRGFQSNYFS